MSKPIFISVKEETKGKRPKNWKYISRCARLRDNNRCKFCGARNKKPHPDTGKKVILTVAHLDHDEENNQFSNLVSLCQRCHLNYDREDNKKRAAETRRRQQHKLILDKMRIAKQQTSQLNLWRERR